MLRLAEHEAVVQERERLQRGRRLAARRHVDRRIGAVERLHQGVRDGAHNGAVDRAPPGRRIVHVVRVVEVARRVVVLEGEEVVARSAHREVQAARDREQGVAQRLRLEPAAVHAPEVAVARVDRGLVGARRRGLPVRGARDDEPVQVLQRLVAAAQPRGEPVEQLGVGGQLPHLPEVVRRRDEAAPEVVVPDAVRDRAPRERVVGVRDPARERQAPRPVVLLRVEARGQRGQGRERPGTDELARRGLAAAVEHVDRPRGAVRRGRRRVHERGLGEPLEVRLRLVARARRGAERGARLEVRELVPPPRQLLAQLGQLALERHASLERGEDVVALTRELREARPPEHAVDEQPLPPRLARLDRVERGDRGAERDVLAAREHDQLAEGEDEVLGALPEPCRRHPHVARGDGFRRLDHDGRVARVREVLGGVVREHGDPRREAGVVRHVDAEARDEAEARARVAAVGLVRADQRHAVDAARRAEVHLHPLLHVGLRRDRAVVAQGARHGLGPRGGREGLLELRDAPLELGHGDAPHARAEGVALGLALAHLALELAPQAGGRGALVEGHVGALDAGEDGLERVVVLERDGVELVLVAARAVHGHADEARHRVRHHVVAVEVARDLLVQRPPRAARRGRRSPTGRRRRSRWRRRRRARRGRRRRRRAGTRRTRSTARPRSTRARPSRGSARRSAAACPCRSRACRRSARRPASAAPSAHRGGARRAAARPRARRRRARRRRGRPRPPRASAAALSGRT